MKGPVGERAPKVTILRRIGDPLETEEMEVRPLAVTPAHLAVLNHLFYDSQVDLGGLVRVDEVTYVCTRSGWRQVPVE